MTRTSCPDRQVLLDYHTGKLAEAVAKGVIAHISSCSSCQATLKTFGESADSLVARLRRAKPEDPYAREPQRQQMLDRVKAFAETIVLRETPPGHVATEPVALGSLGDYELLQKLGEGGMGAVYKARHTRLDKLVALKVLPADTMRDPEMVARFEREMKAVGRLEHPHIVRAMDAGQVGGRHYLAMEYVDGLDLSEVVHRCGPLRIADACEVARQAALGLRYADEHAMVHRDIKPSNLVLDVDGQVKILDLGLALVLREVPPGGEISRTSRVVGTLDYIAPEQCWDSHNVDIRADIYSLGCTVYKLLSGQAPFGEPKYKSSFEKMMAHVQVPAPPLRDLRKDVPERLAAVVERMMAKNREDRYPLPGQVVEALQPYCPGTDLVGLVARARKAVQNPPMPAGSPAAPVTASSSAPEAGTAPPARPPQLLVPPSLPAAAKKPAAEEPFDPYRKWLGIPPEEQPPHHYRLLGIPVLEEDRDVIQAAAEQRTVFLRNVALGKHQALSQRLLNEVQRAKICLLTRKDKAAYDARLLQEMQSKGGQPPSLPPPPLIDQPAAVADPLEFLETTPPVSAKRPGGRWSRRKLLLPVLIGATAAAAAVLLGVIVYFATNKGTVKIELSEPNAKVEVKVDGNQIDVARLKDPLRLSVGYHALEVGSGEFKPVATSFVVHRWGEGVVKVALERPEPPHAIAPFNAAKARGHQEAWARYLGVRAEMVNSIGMKFVVIPPGEFLMGSTDSEKDAPSDEKPQHRVRITRPFSLAIHEVTVGQFRQFVSDTGYKAADEESSDSHTWQKPGWEQTDDHPVVCVNWSDASEFCQWLSRKERVSYRLPTEAEWEYACRAGTASSWCFGDDFSALGEHAWFGENADLKAHQAGQKKPNPFGLCDMHGNAWEWCSDWYGRDYYAVAPFEDPEGPPSEVFRVRRGASWESSASMVRSAFRALLRPDIRGNSTGFRLARTLAPATPAAAASPAVESGTSRDQQPPPLAIAPFDEKKAKEHQQAWAKYLGVQVEITNSIGMKLVLIPPGESTMGTTYEESVQVLRQSSRNSVGDALRYLPSESPAHLVRISRAFYLGRCEVTQAQYRQVTGSNPSRCKESGPDAPVEQVSWAEAVTFCRRLSELVGGGEYRLPTEAEWEYSCRAGTTTSYCFGDDEARLSDYAWWSRNSSVGRTHPVGQKLPNSFGLYDMHGSVWEYCSDFFSSDYYKNSPTADPAGPAVGRNYVRRGGGWTNSFAAGYFRCASRSSNPLNYRDCAFGFRAARSITP